MFFVDLGFLMLGGAVRREDHWANYFFKAHWAKVAHRHREVQSRKHFLQKWKGGISKRKKQMAAFLQVYRFQT